MRKTNRAILMLTLIIAAFTVGTLTAYAAEPVEGSAAGEARITTRAEQSGNPLVGTVFGIYRASDSSLAAETTTDENGTASLALAQGEYYLRNYAVQFGFLTERSRILFSVDENATVIVDVTIQRDANIPYADYGDITLPQTGELPPIMNYALGSALLAVAILCGIGLANQRKHGHKTRKGAKNYA